MKFQKNYLMKFLIYNILLFLSFYKSFSQELNAEVVVNSNLVNQTDKQVFNDFQSSVYQFLNSNRFSSDSYSLIQKIDCSFIFTINSYLTYSQFSCRTSVKVEYRPRSCYNRIKKSKRHPISTEYNNFKYLYDYSHRLSGIYRKKFCRCPLESEVIPC